MRHCKSAQLETAPTKYGGESVYLFVEFTIMKLSVTTPHIVMTPQFPPLRPPWAYFKTM